MKSLEMTRLGGENPKFIFKSPFFQGNEVFAANGALPRVKAGTSTFPVTSSENSKNFIQYYWKTAAVTGDVRGIYNRLYFSAAGASGEAMRNYTTVSGVALSGAHGMHNSLSFTASGSVTGLGVAGRNTLEIADAISGGTYSALQAEIYGTSASASVSSMAVCSFVRMIVDGSTADIKATVDTSGYLFSIQGLTVGSGKLFQANTAGAASHALRILIGSTPYYIMLTNSGA